MMCSDEVYFFIKGRDGADPCDMYESCDECPYHRENGEGAEEDG